jgi:uncharacterized protein (TIRG00374 family)
MDRRVRFALQATVFLALTLGGGGWAVYRGGVIPEDLEPLLHLPTLSVALLVLLSSGLYLSDAWRYRTAGHALDVEVPWTAAAHASIACNFFSCITPGASLGAPAAIVMLGRRGIGWEASTLISFGKSTIGSVLLLIAAFLALATGMGPALPKGITQILAWGTGLSSLVVLGTIVAASRPGRVLAALEALDAKLQADHGAEHWGARVVRRLAAGVVESVERLRAFKPSRIPAIIASQLVYFGCFIGLAVVLGEALGAEPSPELWGVSTVYVAFLYVAPTPGGAGLAEGAATDFFGSLLAPAAAVMTVLLFRALTFYLYVAVGLVHVGWVGGLGAMMAEADAESARRM